MNATWDPFGPSSIQTGDNLPILRRLPSAAFRLIYLDPPFNTGRLRQAEQVRGIPLAEGGNRLGFRGRGYAVTRKMTYAYDDRIRHYWDFLEPRLEEAWRLLTPDGTLYVHLDYREVHYAKVLLDALFGPECFLNEIIWAYDFGSRTKRRWPTKHDNILVYVKDPERYFFDADAVDREPYMAPGLVTPAKAELGKLPTDTWWHTIVSPTGKERTGYPTQKPVGVLRRIIQASSQAGDWVLDPFAGSGTTGVAAHDLGRKFLLIDQHEEAVRIMRRRLQGELS